MIDLTFGCHATCSGEHQRCERGLFHFHNPACVHTFLLVFILAIYLLRGEVLVRFRIWVTHPYIKEYGTLSKPRALMSSRTSGVVLTPLANDSPVINIMTDQVNLRLKILQLVMALYNEAARFTNHCMIDIKGLSTDTYICSFQIAVYLTLFVIGF